MTRQRPADLNPYGIIAAGGSGKITNGFGQTLDDVAFSHNTWLGDRVGFYLDQFPNSLPFLMHRFSSKNNIHGFGRGGIGVTPNAIQGDHSAGDPTFETVIQDWELADAFIHGPNVFVAGYPGGPGALNPAEAPFPYDNAYWGPTNFAAGEFLKPGDPATAGIDYATGILTPTSPLRANAAFGATDGTANGVDFAALNAALAGLAPPVLTGAPRAEDRTVVGTGFPGGTVKVFRNGIEVP